MANKFVVIYGKDQDGNYSYRNYGNYNKNGSNEYITVAEMYNYDVSKFDIFEGSPKHIDGDGASLVLKQRGEEPKNNALFIFEQSYINEEMNKNNISEYKVKENIINAASKIVIEPTDEKNIFMCSIGEYENNEVTSLSNLFNIIGASTTGVVFVLNSMLSSAKEQEEQEEIIERKRYILDIEKIIDEISNKIVGQEETIKTLVSNIYFNQMLIDDLYEDGFDNVANELDSRKQSILLDGSTGTGKTAILKEISIRMGLPLVIVNANSFSETGYVGPSITDILEKLLTEAKGDLELAQRGIVVLDEIDKISESDFETRSMKLGVQKELLGFISGTSYEIGNKHRGQSIDFDTSKLTFILSGAFTGIKDKKISEKNKNKLGFDINDNIDSDNTYEVTAQDYIDYGLMREFFGRVKVLSSTKTYSIEDLKYILLESKISPLKGFEKTVKMFGYKGIIYDEEFLDAVCREAYDMKTGARGLQTIMSCIEDFLLIDLIYENLDINEPITLTTDLMDKYKKKNERTY